MPDIKEALIEKKLTSKIVTHCSDNIIIDLAEKIKTLRFDFPKGINFSLKIKDRNYNCKAEIETENLDIEISEKENREKIIGRKRIEKFENLNSEHVRSFVIIFLKELGLEYEENNDNEYYIEILTNALINGSYNSYSDNTISKLTELCTAPQKLDRKRRKR